MSQEKGVSRRHSRRGLVGASTFHRTPISRSPLDSQEKLLGGSVGGKGLCYLDSVSFLGRHMPKEASEARTFLHQG